MSKNYNSHRYCLVFMIWRKQICFMLFLTFSALSIFPLLLHSGPNINVKKIPAGLLLALPKRHITKEVCWNESVLFRRQIAPCTILDRLAQVVKAFQNCPFVVNNLAFSQWKPPVRAQAHHTWPIFLSGRSYISCRTVNFNHDTNWPDISRRQHRKVH